MTPEKLTDLDLFRRNVVGRSYGLSATKLLFDQPSHVMLTEDEMQTKEIGGSLHANISDDRQFFCSELIAKAFKVLDVMRNPEKGSNNYFPGSFGLNCKIDSELKDDVALGPPINILINCEIALNKSCDL